MGGSTLIKNIIIGLGVCFLTHKILKKLGTTVNIDDSKKYTVIFYKLGDSSNVFVNIVDLPISKAVIHLDKLFFQPSGMQVLHKKEYNNRLEAIMSAIEIPYFSRLSAYDKSILHNELNTESNAKRK